MRPAAASDGTDPLQSDGLLRRAAFSATVLLVPGIRRPSGGASIAWLGAGAPLEPRRARAGVKGRMLDRMPRMMQV